MPAWAVAAPEGVLLRLHVRPGARHSSIDGAFGDRLKVSVAAPPVDERANAALIVFLAGRLGLRRSALELRSGRTGRDKGVLVRGVGPDDVAAALEVSG